MQDQVGGKDFFECCLESGDQFCWQIGDEVYCVRQDYFGVVGQFKMLYCGVKCGEKYVFCYDFSVGYVIEKCRFFGVGIVN